MQTSIPIDGGAAAVIETAAQHMVERVPCGAPTDTVGAMLASIAGEDYDAANAVYVLDDERHLLGVVNLRTLLGAGMQRRLADIMQRPGATAYPDEDQEVVAVKAIGLQRLRGADHRLEAAPARRRPLSRTAAESSGTSTSRISTAWRASCETRNRRVTRLRATLSRVRCAGCRG